MRRATVVGSSIEITFPYDMKVVETVRSIPGRRWIKDRKVWTVPIAGVVDVHIALERHGFVFDEKILEIVGESVERQVRTEPTPDVQIEGHDWKTTPYQHQRYGVSVALNHLDTYGCHALLWEMGTGKTMAALNIVKAMIESGRVRKTLVICPTSLMENWANEVMKHTHYRTVILYGSRAERRSALTRNAEFYIINYEYVASFLEHLIESGFSAVICDESTRIKTPAAAMSKAVSKLGRKVRYKIIMTGTPVTQSPQDAFSQFRFMNEGIFGWSSYGFRNRYCIMGGYGNYQIVGYKNQEELRDKIDRHSTRFLKKDCLDLPDKVFQDIAVEMTDAQKEHYENMAAMILREIEDEFGESHRITAQIVLVKMLRLSQITGGHLRSVEGKVIEFGSAKDKVLMELLEDLTYNGNKVLLWARFIPEIKKLTQFCESRGWQPGAIYGDVKMGERTEIVERFQTDPKCKVFIGQIATAGYGLNLTAATTSIYYSQDWSLEHYLQSQDRNHRIGVVGDKITYINLYCPKTIDQSIQKALNKKKSMADQITGDAALDSIVSIIHGGR